MNWGDTLEIDQNSILTSLMEDYFSNIWAYVYTHTRNQHSTDDLTQEVFVRVFTHLNDFRNESTHKTWLYTIARNVCRDYARSAVIRRVIPMDKRWFEAQSPSPTTGTEDEVVRTILSDELWGEIFKLSLPQREVVLLHLREGLTFREVAGIVNAKEVTVRARYQRALERLRQMLDGGDNDDL
jgi:RNA polymerase sigma-70 factor (ECF subfamily)